MARPLRIEYPGTARGNARMPIFEDDADRAGFLDLVEAATTRFNWRCYAYCLMDNHYHLLVETIDGNLSVGMRHINGVYTQQFNRTHHRVGHTYSRAGLNRCLSTKIPIFWSCADTSCSIPSGPEWLSCLRVLYGAVNVQLPGHVQRLPFSKQIGS